LNKFAKDQKYCNNELAETTSFKTLLNDCCLYLKEKIQNHDVLFPIHGKYNIKYFLDKIYVLICEAVESIKEQFASVSSEEKQNLFEKMFRILEDAIFKLQETSIKDYCHSKDFFNHFSSMLGVEITALDGIRNLEKIVCDYYNMFVYITNFKNRISDSLDVSLPFSSPIFTDKYNYRLISGIEIKINDIDLYEGIKACDRNGSEIDLKENIDYFREGSNFIYCTLEVLRMKNVHSIKAISKNESRQEHIVQ
jgi:hypothetical protein